jgi:hypothetical protein
LIDPDPAGEADGPTALAGMKIWADPPFATTAVEGTDTVAELPLPPPPPPHPASKHPAPIIAANFATVIGCAIMIIWFPSKQSA